LISKRFDEGLGGGVVVSSIVCFVRFERWAGLYHRSTAFFPDDWGTKFVPDNNRPEGFEAFGTVIEWI
jgi:hypothetical protein